MPYSKHRHSLRIALRDHSKHIERANMHCQGITCTSLFYVGLTSSRGQKLEFLKGMANIFFKFYENLKTYKVMPVFNLTQALSLCTLLSLQDCCTLFAHALNLPRDFVELFSVQTNKLNILADKLSLPTQNFLLNFFQ